MTCGSGRGNTPFSLGFAATVLGGGGGISSSAGGIMSAARTAVSTKAFSAVTQGYASVGDVGLDPLQFVTSGAASSLANAHGGSALLSGIVGAAPSGLTAAMDNPADMFSGITSHALRFVPDDVSSNIQIFNQVDSLSNLSLDIMPTITRMAGTDFGDITSVVKDFSDGGFLGPNFLDFNDLATNGLGSLTNGASGSLGSLTTAFGSYGKFGDFSDVSNLLQPGQIASQLLSNDLGDIGNIATSLEAAGIPLDDLTNPIYQTKIQGVLNGVTDVTDLVDIQKVMGSSVNLNSLGDLTDISRVIDSNVGASFTDFADMREKFSTLDLGNVVNFEDLSDMMGGVTDITDLDILVGQTQLISDANLNALTQFYGGGTGPDGSILIRDMLGSAAGYGIEAYMPTYKTAMDQIIGAGLTNDVQDMYDEAVAGLQGDYLDIPGDFVLSTDITDPRTGEVFTEMEDFLASKTSQISGALSSISHSNNDYLDIVANNWNAAATQVNTEYNIYNNSDVDISLISPGDRGSVVNFARRLNDLGLDQRNAASYLEKIADPNLGGQFLKAALREGRNIAAYGTQALEYAGGIADDTETIADFVPLV